MSDSPDSADPNDERHVAMLELLAVVWRGRRVLICVVAAALLVGALYLRFATYTYTATLSVIPVEAAGGSGLSSQIGSLGGLASLAGVSLPVGAGNSSFQLYVESMQSRAVADELARDEHLMSVVFAREWDSGSRTWRPPSGLRTVKDFLLGLVGADGFRWHAPDGARLQEYLDDHLSVVQNAKKQVVTVTFSHRNPAFAARFLATLHSVVDDRVRQRTLARTSESIAYLTAKLATVTNIEHQKAIAQALSEQEKLRMMASSSAPFAAEPFGEPRSSYQPTHPQPMLVLVLSAVIGVLGASAWLLIMAAFGRRQASA